jgi:rod shape-determining protein MreD
VLVSGLLLDSLSGGPFGIYVTIYFWLFVGINWITQYLHAKNLILLLVFIVVGVLFEHFISIGVAFIIHKNLTFTLFAINVAKRQILWSLVAGPLLVFGLSLMHQRWMQWVEFVHEKRSE